MKIIFCGGGTAGHINPALTIAKEIQKEYINPQILFIGRSGGKENKLIEKEGYDLKTIKITGLKRKITFENIYTIKNTFVSYKESKRIIKEFNPDIVLGTGGYVCLPVLLAARSLGIKTAIHESNAVAGLTTKLLSRRVDLVLLNFEKAKRNLSEKVKIKVVGNPINEKFYLTKRSDARKKLGLREDDFFILSFGGSLGSEKINEAIISLMKSYSENNDKIIHLHATGEKYYEKIKKEDPLPRGSKCKILPFIDNLPTIMPAADLVISRCGAMTISEICASGVASILIPSPNVTDNHQFKNAQLLRMSSAAYMLEEEKLSADELKKLVLNIKSDEIGRKNAAKCVKELFIPNSAKYIVDELKKLVCINHFRQF